MSAAPLRWDLLAFVAPSGPDEGLADVAVRLGGCLMVARAEARPPEAARRLALLDAADRLEATARELRGAATATPLPSTTDSSTTPGAGTTAPAARTP